MAAEVRYSNAALSDLKAIFDWVAGEAGIGTASAYTVRIEARCESLSDFPSRGTPRGQAGERSLPFERRASILYRTDGSEVLILGIFHAGREIDIG